MRALAFLLICLVTGSVQAQLEINLVGDFDSSSKQPISLGGVVMMYLREQLEDDITFHFVPASNYRQWRELEQADNVCVYNKIKTDERAQKAHFSALPIVFFPAPRLVAQRRHALPNTVSLANLSQRHLRIGVDDARSFGESIDHQLANMQDKLIVIQGSQATQRIRGMLVQDKIDVIIDYYPAFITHPEVAARLDDFTLHLIQHAPVSAQGYMACSNTPKGAAAMAVIDRKLATQEAQQHIIDLHEQAFPAADFQLLEPSLRSVFNTSKPSLTND